MNTRRDFLRLSALVPLAAIPFTTAPNLKTVKQTRKSYEERSKYLEYTEQDFMYCKLILRDMKGRRLWAPPISEVSLEKDPFRARMYVSYKNVPADLHLRAMQFVDKDNRMLFAPVDFTAPIHTQRGNELRIHYKIELS